METCSNRHATSANAMKLVSSMFDPFFWMINIRPVPRPTCGQFDIAFFYLILLASSNDLNLVLIIFSHSVTLKIVVPYLSCWHTVYHHVSVFAYALFLMRYFRPVLILVEITSIAK
jgi:hypothetical protein